MRKETWIKVGQYAFFLGYLALLLVILYGGERLSKEFPNHFQVKQEHSYA